MSGSINMNYIPAIEVILKDEGIRYVSRALGGNCLFFCTGKTEQNFNLRLMEDGRFTMWWVYPHTQKMTNNPEFFKTLNELNNSQQYIRLSADEDLGICAMYSLHLTGGMETAADEVRSSINSFLDELEKVSLEYEAGRVSC